MAHNDDSPSLLDAEEAFEQGDVETALAICEGLLEPDENKAPIEALYLAAECLLEMQESGEALHLIEIALRTEPDSPLLHHTRGVCLFEQVRLGEAAECFAAASKAEEPLGETFYYLAVLAERGGDAAAAQAHYEQAVALDPENLALPADWSEEQLKTTFDEIVEEVPELLGTWLAGLPIEVIDQPSDDDLQGEEGPISPLVHCLFDGHAESPAEGKDPELWLSEHPRRVRFFRLSLGKSAQDEYELHREMLEAIIWEMIEFLGLDPSHLAALGLVDEEDDEDLHGHRD